MHTRKSVSRLATAGASAALLGAILVSVGTHASGAARTATPFAVSTTLKWSVTLNDAGQQIVFSSPTIGNLDGRYAVLVGDRKGRELAYHLDDGSLVPGWPNNAGAPIDAPASVAEIGPGGRDVVFVGVGTQSNASVGGYLAINPNGTRKWFVPAKDPNGSHGVASGMAEGSLQGLTAVVGGSMGQDQDAINTPTGHVLNGFPWFQGDSNLTTPAIADVFHDGRPVIIEGGDQTAGLAYGRQYTKGGHMRVLSGNGWLGHSQPNQGTACDFTPDEIVRSSPAVGQFTPGGSIVAIFGTGTLFHGTSTNHLFALFANNCGVIWNVALDGDTSSSPALADLLGNGSQQVVEATRNSVYALDGANHGRVIWRNNFSAQGVSIIGSVVTADLRGTGHQDVIVASTSGVDMLDGKTGGFLGQIGSGLAFQNSALITDDPNGTIGITIAGYNGHAQGVIQHYEIPRSNGSHVAETGAWPMFHHDRRLRGFAGL